MGLQYCTRLSKPTYLMVLYLVRGAMNDAGFKGDQSPNERGKKPLRREAICWRQPTDKHAMQSHNTTAWTQGIVCFVGSRMSTNSREHTSFWWRTGSRTAGCGTQRDQILSWAINASTTTQAGTGANNLWLDSKPWEVVSWGHSFILPF